MGGGDSGDGAKKNREAALEDMQEHPGSWAEWPEEDALGVDAVFGSIKGGVLVGRCGFQLGGSSIGDWHVCIWEMSCHGW